MQGERSSNTDTKKSKAIRGGTRQAHIDRVVNQEADEEIRKAYTIHDYLEDVESYPEGKEENS